MCEFVNILRTTFGLGGLPKKSTTTKHEIRTKKHADAIDRLARKAYKMNTPIYQTIKKQVKEFKRG